MAARMGAIADVAVHSTQALPQGRLHAVLFVAMAGLYLSHPAARLPHAAQTTERLTVALRSLAQPILLMHRVRSWIGRDHAPKPKTGSLSVLPAKSST